MRAVIGLGAALVVLAGCGDDSMQPPPPLPDAGPAVDPARSGFTLCANFDSVLADGVHSCTIDVELYGTDGQPFVGHSVVLEASGSNNQLVQPSNPTDHLGFTRGEISSTRAEAKSITAIVDGRTRITALHPITFIGGSPQSIAFGGLFPVNDVDAPLGVPLQVAILDAFGNLSPMATDTITLHFGANPTGAMLVGPTRSDAVSGIASFQDLSVDRVGMGYTLVADSTMYGSATSIPFDVRLPRWQSVGPYADDVGILVVAPSQPSIVYAGTPHGLYRSSDAGGHWTSTSTTGWQGLLVVDPNDANRIFGPGPTRSRDGGTTWVSIADPLPNGFRMLSIDPVTSTLFAATEIGVYRSDDGGTTWSRPGPNLFAGYINVASTPPTSTLVITTAGPLNKSVDSGATFTALTPPPPSPYSWLPLIDPANANIIYASPAVFSIDGGQSWSLTQLSSSAVAGSYKFLSTNPSTLYLASDSGLYRSISGSTTWTQVTTIPTRSVGSDGASTLYLGSSMGIFKSTNNGATFASAGYGLSGYDVAAMEIAPSSGVILVAGSQGIFKSTDAGATWTPLDPTPVQSFGIDPLSPEIEYAVVRNGGLLKTTDGWSTSTPILPQLPGVPGFMDRTEVFVVAASRSTPNLLFIGGSYGTNANDCWRSAGPNCHVPMAAKSLDGGATWSDATTGLGAYATTLLISPSNPNLVFAGTGAGLYVSGNGGAAWEAQVLGAGMPAIRAITIDPTTPTRMFVVASDGLYRSTDGGATWTATGVPGAHTGAVLVDPTQPMTIYAGGDQGVHKSTDGGLTWLLTSPPFKVTSLAMDPTDPRTVYVGILSGARGGVWKTTTGGE